jgi:hypothetical protein
MSPPVAEARQLSTEATAGEKLRLGWRAAISFHRRLFGLAVHDLSNPLAAARLLAELGRRGASGQDDLAALLEQLGVAAERLQALRILLREGGPESFAVTTLLELAVKLVAREADRAGARLLVDLGEEITVNLRRHFFLQAVLAGLLASLRDAQEGDVLILRARCRQAAEGQGEQLLVELESSTRVREASPPEELLCLEMLASDLGGRFEILPGGAPPAGPEWRLLVEGAL